MEHMAKILRQIRHMYNRARISLLLIHVNVVHHPAFDKQLLENQKNESQKSLVEVELGIACDKYDHTVLEPELLVPLQNPSVTCLMVHLQQIASWTLEVRFSLRVGKFLFIFMDA